VTFSPDVGIMRGVLQRLAMLAHARRQGVQNPERDQAAATFFASQLRLLLDQHMPVALEFTEDTVLYSDTEVNGSDLMAENLTEGLYSEGLRSLYVDLGATDEELSGLAMLLSRNWLDKASDQDDLEASSWKASFDHIHLDIAARRVVAATDTEQLSPEQMIVRLVRQLGDEEFELSSEQIEAQIARALADLRSCSVGALKPNPELLTSPDHRRLVRGMARAAEARDMGDDNLSLVLFEAVRCADDPEIVADLMGKILTHARWDLREGRPDAALGRLRRLMMVADVDLLPDIPQRETILIELERLWGEEFREALLEGWEANPDVETWQGPLFTLGQAMSRSGVESMLEFAAALPERGLRQALADAMLTALDQWGVTLRELLDAATETQLPVILLGFARVTDRTAVEPLLAKVSSEDPVVREAVLVALRAHQSPRIKATVRKSLADDARAVRLEALRYVCVYRDAEASETIMGRIEGARADTYDVDELSALTRAYAIINREGGVATLSTLAARHIEPRKNAHPELLTAVLSGLAASGPAGRAAIQQLGREHPELRGRLREVLSS